MLRSFSHFLQIGSRRQPSYFRCFHKTTVHLNSFKNDPKKELNSNLNEKSVEESSKNETKEQFNSSSIPRESESEDKTASNTSPLSPKKVENLSKLFNDINEDVSIEELKSRFKDHLPFYEDYIRNHPLAIEALQKSTAPRQTGLKLNYVSKLDKYVTPLDGYSHLGSEESNGEIPDKWEDFKDDLTFEISSKFSPFDFGDAGKSTSDAEFLSDISGIPKSDLRALMFVPLVRRRVVNQTRKGKIASMYVLTVVGNRNGVAGFGEGKAESYSLAYKQSCGRAVKNMVYIPRYDKRTVYGVIHKKFHAVRLTLRSRPAGFGLRCNPILHEICRCAGIKDISGEILGSKNGMNTVKAMFEALQSQRLPEDIAMERGQKFVDVQREYYKQT